MKTKNQFIYIHIYIYIYIYLDLENLPIYITALSAWAVEYTDCTSAEG